MRETGETHRARTQALEERERRLYLEGVAADYERLRADPAAWAEFQNELALWDSTNDDGLEDL